MKTLILKHNGHEAHVPYELPDSLRFDCFVPGMGIGWACVDVRSDTIDVVDSSGIPCDAPAILEQAGDVARTFLEALPIEWSECKKAENESSVAFVHRAGLIESSWTTSARPSDMDALSKIAALAHHEKEAEIAFYLLPSSIRCSIPMLRYSHNGMAEKALAAFITNVLIPRAQDLAAAAAKRREAEWNEEQDARCEHCDGSGEGRCGGRCPLCRGKGRPTARLTGFAKEGA